MPDVMSRPTTIGPKEVADALGVTRRTVYRWIEDDTLPTTQTGEKGRHRIFERQLAEKIGEQAAADVFDSVADNQEA